jgi:hypothetical protein
VCFENHTKAIYKIGENIQRISVLRERESGGGRDRSEIYHLLGCFLDVLALEDKTGIFPETSVRNYHSTLYFRRTQILST